MKCMGRYAELHMHTLKHGEDHVDESITHTVKMFGLFQPVFVCLSYLHQ